MQVKQITPFIGVEITGASYEELIRPEAWAQVEDGVQQHELVVVRGIELTPQQQLDLAARLGRPVPFVITKYRHPEIEEIMISSNESKDGKPLGVARVGNFWHQDSSFTPEPTPYTMLHGLNVPSSSGHTKFASAVDVYRRLPEEWRVRLADRVGVHTVSKRLRIRPEHLGLSVAEFQAQADVEHPPVEHPLLRKDEWTGEPYIYGCREYMHGILGFSLAENEEFFELMDELITDEEHVYTHVWTQNDLLIWKTFTAYHIATEVEPGVGRTVHRISIDPADRVGGPVDDEMVQ